MTRSILVVAALALPTLLGAQTFDPATSAMRQEWGTIVSNIRKAAEQMPEADFTYRPVTTVRTFAQIIAHIADAQLTLCAVALGIPAKASDLIERTVFTKAELLKKLQESTQYCSRAYAQDLGDSAIPRGARSHRYYALAHNTAHDDEHYGNLVTYLRIKGLVPPSSQP